MEYIIIVDACLLEVILQLGQVPFRGIFSIFLISCFAGISTIVLNVVIVFLIDGVVGEMDVSLVG